MSEFLMFTLSLCPMAGLTTTDCLEKYNTCKYEILKSPYHSGQNIEVKCTKQVAILVKESLLRNCSK